MKLSDYIKLQEKQLQAAKYIGRGYRIFFGGSRGGGKTHLALAVAVLSAKRYPGLRIMIVRHTMPELLENFVVPLTQKYPEHIFKYRYRVVDKVAVFDNGSRIIFKAIENENDTKKVQGVEYQLLIIDEAPNFTESVLFKLYGSLRRNVIQKNFIPTVLMTGNPGGVSDRYFKTRFIRPDYNQWTEGELAIKDKFVFIQSHVSDNKYIGEEYVNNLKSLPEHLFEAWYNGNWDVFEGMFFAEFSVEKNVIAPFEIPKDWNRAVGMDIGFTEKHPTVAVWVAQNPETQELFVYKEYSAVGSIMQYIYDMRDLLKDDDNVIVFLDPSAWGNQRKYDDDRSPAMMMLEAGIPVVRAINDRVSGWRILKAWMADKMKIFDVCPGLITTLPALKYTSYGKGAKEDLDTRMEDDYADALRYAVVSGFGYPVVDHDEPVVYHVKQITQRGERITHKEWVDMFNYAEY